MKFLIDENIPYAEAFFSSLGTIERFAGRELKAEQLKDVDVLLVRSITKVNDELLSQANKLKFVGTATIGEDHIDKQLLKQRGIEFSSAPGCNATSVAEFVISALLVLHDRYNLDFINKTIAIVGVGNIGKRLLQRLNTLNVDVLLCDPVRQDNESDAAHFIDLNDALARADIISFHTPLTRDGAHPTFHLLNENNLPLLKDDVVLINSCRGEVIDNQALYNHIIWREESSKPAIKLVLDVWEGEPNPMPALIEKAELATAHIAGYSLEGKARGTEMLYQKVCALLAVPSTIKLSTLLPIADVASTKLAQDVTTTDELKKLVHLVFDVRRDDGLFRELLNSNGFDWLRKNYPTRREWSSLQVEIEKRSTNSIDLSKIGFAI
ncbi:4-phosphoerythronate dehydrogenase [Psychrosphaera sp. B3R10]|uniref:4-phosphoerythronate dehydrogenase n=1 Tax=unclassified Psychrosphaera TaxID=2641570 RepID=UPI001C07F9E4|nr:MULTISPECIES: 4-phosphoerythronate dehydrogenase [unclassified Psychrosphaera]MBU2880920.1 4-phosphoerythronate dehydrogenase [Psychrosphaera sp. I2R16]MBU2990861.1 4-phosphoerythronate dehydrogenase [Psychrosphaera sp. B3R10]